ncbi:hypothetical protein [Mycobacterium sp. TY814]|uniref:TolB family protein n=1 Tax=unclassified Mycobacterium TaxID=2642494 RepID=UPI002741946B|nr:hypothetical protein [Mycobacterium sp. TY814]MDP7725200.1 hypothetical protein [Mycobacterium sp. TY814]
MNTAHRGRWAALLAVLVLTACQPASRTNPATTQTNTTVTSATTAPKIAGALFYTKAGALYVSEPAGAPGRKLTDGPADAQPAPSPDLAHVAFVRKAAASDYGGELWVLDLSPQLTPLAPPRRLVDPAGLPHAGGDRPPMVARPRWSPTGQHVAFVGNPTDGAVEGGILLVAAANTGEITPRPKAASESATAWAPFAEPAFAWAPDGSHIAWLDERSDVRPTNVNALAVGGESTPVATGTNASSVIYARDGRTILFTNGDTSDSIMFPKNPFTLRTGGVYSVAASVETGATPAAPTPLFTAQGWSYRDLTILDSGAVAFTAQRVGRNAPTSKAIQVLDKGSSVPRTTVSEVPTTSICQSTPRGGRVCYAGQEPAWGAGNVLAYLDNSPEVHLIFTDAEGRDPKQVDTGVDSFAFPPVP